MGNNPIASTALIPAAQYVRMSTDHQQYSILSQTLANQQYAEAHGFTIIRSYEDPNKSGLSLKGRVGLALLFPIPSLRKSPKL